MINPFLCNSLLPVSEGMPHCREKGTCQVGVDAHACLLHVFAPEYWQAPPFSVTLSAGVLLPDSVWNYPSLYPYTIRVTR